MTFDFVLFCFVDPTLTFKPFDLTLKTKKKRNPRKSNEPRNKILFTCFGGKTEMFVLQKLKTEKVALHEN